MRDVVQWTSPAPLWGAAAEEAQGASRRARLQRPAILRFASDSFMQDLLTLLENDPARLADLVAQPETWRGLTPTPAPVETAPKFALPLQRLRLAAERKRAALIGANSAGTQPLTVQQNASTKTARASMFRRAAGTTLKLYQPAHQRYYMIASCLVCGRAGLPDKSLDKGRDESATFVIRRKLPATVKNSAGRPVPFVNPQTGAVDPAIPLPAFDETWEEYALITTREGETGWRKVSDATNRTADVLVDGEEQLPLFPMSYADDAARRRRVLAGLIPVGRRETYMSAASLLQSQISAATATANSTTDGASSSGPADDGRRDPRMRTLWLDVTEPWKVLLQQADSARAMQEPSWIASGAMNPAPKSDDKPLSDEPEALKSSIKATREQIQTGSWYILLDFAKYLEENLPDVWAAIVATTSRRPAFVAALAGKPAELDVYNALASAALTGWRATSLESNLYPTNKIKTNLADALRAVALEDKEPDAETRLETAKVSYKSDKFDEDKPDEPDPAFPSFLFPLAHAELSDEPSNSWDVALGPLPVTTVAKGPDDSELDFSRNVIDAFAGLIQKALPPRRQSAPVVASSLPLAAQRPLDTREGYFVVRCVYQRPLCVPFEPTIVGEASREFQLASFFDPDAPARPIRIALPVDTSPAGLRKFDKNTAFMMSDMLCGQVERMKGLSLGDLIRSVLPWPLHKDLSVPDGGACTKDAGLEVGMICSLSIPIITICALLLLMIIVNLLDIIFRWLPYFIICFPLPGFASKPKNLNVGAGG
jgi:hypothetical protein